MAERTGRAASSADGPFPPVAVLPCVQARGRAGPDGASPLTAEQDAQTATWTELTTDEAIQWCGQLLHTPAPIWQYPMWTEFYRRPYLRPVYLVCHEHGVPAAFVSILKLAYPTFRMGLVVGGPASLLPEQQVSDAAIGGLLSWAATHRYLFLRFAKMEASLHQRLLQVGKACERDAFPFCQEPGTELVVPLQDSEEAMLCAFKRNGRRKIRLAGEAGYEISEHCAPEALRDVWPLFEQCAQRKGFRLYRPLAAHMELMRLAQPYGCAKLYVAALAGKAVEAILVLRDRDTAHALIAALDLDALEGRDSPSCLLHWRAMRDAQRLGARGYNFGEGPGGVGQFKHQFSPVEVAYPPSVNLIANRRLCWLWLATAVPVCRAIRPVARRILSPTGR